MATERPILFSGAMVRAILEGSKTQTRRVMKPQPPAHMERVAFVETWPDKPWCLTGPQLDENGKPLPYEQWEGGWPDCTDQFGCPYGKPGTHLWVRETWAKNNNQLSDHHSDVSVVYRADSESRALDNGTELPWKPSIHMPRSYSRLTLEIVSVKVERVQEISETDSIAEGVKFGTYEPGKCRTCGRGAFMDLWNSINEKRGFGWDKNPWVWAITLKKLGAGEPSEGGAGAE